MMVHRNLMKTQVLKLSIPWILSLIATTVTVKERGSRNPKTRGRRVNMRPYDNQRKRNWFG